MVSRSLAKAGSGNAAKASATLRSYRLSSSMAPLIEVEVVDRLVSSAMSSGTGSRRSGRAASNVASSSADIARSASVRVRGRGGSLRAVTSTAKGIDTSAAWDSAT